MHGASIIALLPAASNGGPESVDYLYTLAIPAVARAPKSPENQGTGFMVCILPDITNGHGCPGGWQLMGLRPGRPE